MKHTCDISNYDINWEQSKGFMWKRDWKEGCAVIVANDSEGNRTLSFTGAFMEPPKKTQGVEILAELS